MISTRTATLQDVDLIIQLAAPAWQATYSPILSQAQVDYMFGVLYTPAVLSQHINLGTQHFVLIFDGDIPRGFAAYGLRPENNKVCKLHKLYLLPEEKGRGLGRILLEEIESRSKQMACDCLELNVNKYNPSKEFYGHLGFEIAYEEDIAIGEYWMNDYVMRKTLS